jgi:hypothetical protein
MISNAYYIILHIKYYFSLRVNLIFYKYLFSNNTEVVQVISIITAIFRIIV